jgi:hypothetical protein
MINLSNHNYYRPKEGRWRGFYEFSITDWSKFWSSPMDIMDRLFVISVALSPKLIGRATIDTSVDYSSKGEQGSVGHTTRGSKWGITFFRSTEAIILSENGIDFSLRGEQRIWPRLWRARDFGESKGEVDPTGTKASYTFTWLGAELKQHTEPEGDELTIYQTTAWSKAEFRLHRV